MTKLKELLAELGGAMESPQKEWKWPIFQVLWPSLRVIEKAHVKVDCR